MPGWYSVGTVSVTNGSTVVTGAGTDFVSNVTARDALLVAGGSPLEIASVQSATTLTLASPWLGATGNGQAYKVQPTVGIYVDLALRVLNMLTPFQAVLDGIARGLMPDGTAAAPGMRFASDQDTGMRRWGENVVSIVGGGVDTLLCGPGGVTLNAGAVRSMLGTTAGIGVDTNKGLHWSGNGQETLIPSDGVAGWVWQTDGRIVFRTIAGATKMTLDASGNLIVGTTGGGTNHSIFKNGVGVGGAILQVASNTGDYSATFYGVDQGGGNGSATGLKVGKNSTTGRSLNAGGTLNANGADYAEYMFKADGCGPIAKGDVCGVDGDGKLTRSWGAARSFVVKSTDPAYVGGDSWSAHLPPRPEAPGEAPTEPVHPAPTSPAAMPIEPVRQDGEEDLDFIRRMAAYLVEASALATTVTADREALAAYQAASAAYPAAKAEYDAAVAAHEAELTAWEKDLEAARQTVDRIVFSGQVPVNVDDATLAACGAALADGVAIYLVAVARGAGIGASAVREGDMTLPLYMRRIGAVWAIRDGRPWVDVQHG